ncbi:MAG: hypothetical protein J5J06_02955 [Phycisphaerae bacterium]|nr:hypothetical protein [Phycisphaerae bacterium]
MAGRVNPLSDARIGGSKAEAPPPMSSPPTSRDGQYSDGIEERSPGDADKLPTRDAVFAKHVQRIGRWLRRHRTG